MQEEIFFKINNCKNCNNNFQGKFCNQCGEKIYSENDKKLSHIFEELFHFITHFEGTFFVTLKAFIKTPGKFSLDYTNGLRKKYFKPISFFLILVILYLLFPKFQGLNMKLGVLAHENYGFSSYTLGTIKQKLSSKQIDFTALQKLYDTKSPAISKITLFTFIPLSALIFYMLFWYKKKVFFDHFILATEVSSFFIFLNFLLLPFIAFLTSIFLPQLNSIYNDDSWIWIFTSLIFLANVIIAFRKFYNCKWYIACIWGVLYCYVLIDFIRFIVSLLIFYITMFFV